MYSARGGAPPDAAPGRQECLPHLALPRLVRAAALVLLVVLLYLPSLRNGFVYDDETLILKEARPDSVEAFTEIFAQRHFPTVPYYRPVSRLTFRIQHALHGKRAAPFHAFNAVLAGLTALAAYGLLRRRPFKCGPTSAFLASLLFMVHPVASSTVYPACSGRETLLPAFFMLLAMQCWLLPGLRARLGALVLWGLALFAKEQAIMLPCLFLLSDALDLTGSGRLRRPARLCVWYGAMVVIAVVYAIIRQQIFGGSEWLLAVDKNPWGPALSYLYALQTLFVPFIPLVYEPPPDIWLFPPWRAGVAVLTTVALVVAVFRFRKTIGGLALFWTAWFFLIQLPTANILEQEARFDERYVFLAGLAVPALAAAAVSAWSGAVRHRRALLAAGCGLVAICSAITLSRAAAFRDDLTFSLLWTQTNPRAPIPWNNIGAHWLNAGRLKQAEPALRKALTYGPGLADAHYNIGLLLFKTDRAAAAVEAYREALRLDPRYAAEYNLALALQTVGEVDQAREIYLAAIRKTPNNPDAHYNLGLLYAKANETDAAIRCFREAARLRPDDAEPVYNIGVALEGRNRFDEALEAYQQAKRLAPGRADVRQNLGNVLFRKGRHAEAIIEYDTVLTIEPDNVQVRMIRDAARQEAAR